MQCAVERDSRGDPLSCCSACVAKWRCNYQAVLAALFLAIHLDFTSARDAAQGPWRGRRPQPIRAVIALCRNHQPASTYGRGAPSADDQTIGKDLDLSDRRASRRTSNGLERCRFDCYCTIFLMRHLHGVAFPLSIVHKPAESVRNSLPRSNDSFFFPTVSEGHAEGRVSERQKGSVGSVGYNGKSSSVVSQKTRTRPDPAPGSSGLPEELLVRHREPARLAPPSYTPSLLRPRRTEPQATCAPVGEPGFSLLLDPRGHSPPVSGAATHGLRITAGFLDGAPGPGPPPVSGACFALQPSASL